ncbi:vanadium-dependent haloperoxidase [Cellulomonas sp. Leaf395]|uniref:vanadium-dependent haloperoxidase n=1 Tax=Cellulomonas sp. Leaf395 TaxID=1736362 RepID=UPI000AF5AECC|nr:vanadium-dependent haloperoxidase [Cellulomonas sp. Leaf395]
MNAVPRLRALRLVAPALLLALVASPAGAAPPPENVATTGGGPGAVVEWNEIAGDVALAACLAPAADPPHEARMYAMMHLAVHDALNTIDRRYERYVPGRGTEPDASPEAAVAAAARAVLVAVAGQVLDPIGPDCAAAGVDVAEQAYAERIGAVPDGRAKSAGIAVGEAAAATMLALRADDGAPTTLLDPSYPQGTEPGQWRFTPGFDVAALPGWGQVRPFLMTRELSYPRAYRPYPLTSRRYATDVDEVQRLGGDGTTTPSARTPEQTQVALFWVESSPLQWNRVARTLAQDARLDLWESARMFALLDVALSDAYVDAFRVKYELKFWRPVTAIREAETDGNPATTADPTWTPLVVTPPIPDQYSGHAAEGAAAVEVLRRVLGTDRLAFSTCSLTLSEGQRCDDPTPVLRSYERLSQASAENGESRILVGFHFRHAVDDGLAAGTVIGRDTVQGALRPLHRAQGPR